MEGILRIRPKIKKIAFKQRGKMELHLEDGRVVIIPLRYFPSIKTLTEVQRRKWYVTDGELFSFEDCDEVFHIEQVLGKESDYTYHFGGVTEGQKKRHVS